MTTAEMSMFTMLQYPSVYMSSVISPLPQPMFRILWLLSSKFDSKGRKVS
jgi:hypothetical protein